MVCEVPLRGRGEDSIFFDHSGKLEHPAAGRAAYSSPPIAGAATALESYELDEVDVPIGEAKKTVHAMRITIYGKNIFLRALEPIVRIGDTEVLHPRIKPDEQTITGFVTDEPPEGAAITLQYPGQAPLAVPERFTLSKLQRSQL